MKRLYFFLKILLGCMVGIFVGNTLYRCWDYFRRPDFYAMQSAPWYLPVLVTGVLTAAAAVLLLIVMRMLKRKMKSL